MYELVPSWYSNMSLPVPNLALALSANVAWDPVNTLKAFAVNVKSSAPEISISI